MKKETLWLTADQFDALHISALAFGGIGAKTFSEGPGSCEFPQAGTVPVCGIGTLRLAGKETKDITLPRKAVTTQKWYVVWPFSPVEDNDKAVARINRRRGKPKHTRVPFLAFVRELNIDILPETA